VRSRSEEAVVGRMAAIDVRMRDTRKDAEVFAMALQELEIR